MLLSLRTCVVRPWECSDATALLQYANNRNVWRNLRDRFPHPYTKEDADAFLRFAMAGTPVTHFAIVVKEEAVGGIGLEMGSDVHRRTAELGYWLGEPFWGRGIMSKAVEAFTRVAFERFDLDRIYAEPFATNRRSARVLERAGFAFEGRMRANAIKDGERLDSLLYARLREGI